MPQAATADLMFVGISSLDELSVGWMLLSGL